MPQLNVGTGRALLGVRDFSPLDLPNKWAWFKQGVGVTGSLNASRWDDSFGLGHHAPQATGANQPIHLPFVGSKYCWLPNVAANHPSTADSSALDISGDIAIVFHGAANDWTVGQYLLTKLSNTSDIAYNFYVDTNKTLIARFSVLGTVVGTEVATSSAAATLTNAAIAYLAVSRSGTSVKFWTSVDGVNWSQLGTTQTITTTTIFNSNQALRIGADGNDSASRFTGKVYRTQVYSGVPPMLGGAGSASPVADFNPALAADDSTSFVASTGETWTINSTGAKKAQIVGSASLLFDGVAHYLKAAGDTLNQPLSVVLFGRQVTWTLNGRVFDGNTADSAEMIQHATTPDVDLYAGTTETVVNSDWTLNTYKLITAVFNGASSSITVNVGTPATGNPGSQAAGGFTLGAPGAGAGSKSNIQIREAIVLSGALTAADIANLYRYGQRRGLCA